MPKAVAPSDARIRILFLSANPVTMSALRLSQEARQIEEKIGASKHRDAIELIAKWAVRPDDLQQVLLDVEPHIVHFSGHGSDEEGLYFESPEGISAPVDKETLVHLLGVLKGNIRLVMLNACQTRALAEAIAGSIDCAVGTGADIGDEAAIEFSAAFYRAIGFGKSIKVAFDLGQSALKLKQIPEDRIPELFCRSGVNPDEVNFDTAPVKPRGVLLELRGFGLLVKLSVAFVLVAGITAAITIPLRGPGGRTGAPDIAAFQPASDGIVLIGPWMESAGGKALCDALKKAFGSDSVRCLPYDPGEAEDPTLRTRARQAGAAVLALVGKDGQARVTPLGLLENDPIAGGEFSLDLARTEDQGRTVTLLGALARLAKRGEGFTSEEVPCPSINPGPLDRLTLLSQVLVPSCARVPIDLSTLQDICDRPGSDPYDCGLASDIYVERCPTCTDVRAKLQSLRDRAPARFRSIATLKLARADCEAGRLADAAAALNALPEGGPVCLDLAISEVAACVVQSSILEQPKCKVGPCGGPIRVRPYADDPKLRASEQASIADRKDCSPQLRARVLGGRAFYRARGADLAGAEADYTAAFTLSHEPLYELSLIEILLRLKKTKDAQTALGAIASIKLEEPHDKSYAALLRWVAARDSGSPTLKLDAAALADLYRALPLSATALRDPDDKDLQALACPPPAPSPCAFDVLANPKTSASEEELAQALTGPTSADNPPGNRSPPLPQKPRPHRER